MTSPVSLEPLELTTAWHRLTCVSFHCEKQYTALRVSLRLLDQVQLCAHAWLLWCDSRRWLYCPQKDLSHCTAWGEELIGRADGLGPRWAKCGSQWLASGEVWILLRPNIQDGHCTHLDIISYHSMWWETLDAPYSVRYFCPGNIWSDWSLSITAQ